MRPEVLRSRAPAVLTSLERQTGRRSGGPTGGCMLTVAEFLSGHRYDLEGVKKLWSQRTELISLGLDPYDVIVGRRVSRTSALDALLGQQLVGADALLVRGKINGSKRGDSTHITAVIFDEGEPHHIVDSLVSGGLFSVNNNVEVKQYLLAMFDESSFDFDVIPTEEEKVKRLCGVEGKFVGVHLIPGVTIMTVGHVRGLS